MRAQWGQNGGAFAPPADPDAVDAPASIPAAAAAPGAARAHGYVQPVHAVQGGVPEVQAGGVRGEAEIAGVHGRRMVQDAGRAEHLAVQLVDQRQRTIRVVGAAAQQRRARGALKEVLQTATAAVLEVPQSMLGCGGGRGGGRLWRRCGGGQTERRGGRGGGGWVGVQVGEGGVRIGFEIGDFWVGKEETKTNMNYSVRNHYTNM